MWLRIDLQCGREGIREVLIALRRNVLSLVFLRVRSRARVGAEVGVWYLYVELGLSVISSHFLGSIAYRQIARPPQRHYLDRLLHAHVPVPVFDPLLQTG